MGKTQDAIGLYYYGARFYDPELGRFISVDPARDGFNWWVYCRKNPLRFIDPTGLANMAASEALIAFMLDYERFSSKPYRGQDSQDLTIGYGHVIMKGEDFGDGITEEQARELFAKDLQPTVNDVNALLGDTDLTQNQFDTLVDFAFNCGVGALKESTLLKLVKTKNVPDKKIHDDKIHKAFDAYCNSDHKFSLGLWRRREDEWEMWNEADYERDYPNRPK